MSTEVQTAAQLLRDMSLEEKIGQVFIFTWINEAQAHNDLRFYPGGYIRIYSDALTVVRQTATIHDKSRIPLIISADLERGIGGTIAGAVEVVSKMAVAATGDESASFDAGRIIGEEALAMGINMNYAPVLDINSNPENPVINIRSFGADPDLVSRFGIAFMKGLQAAGVATSGKHFPGHGDSQTDSHEDLGTLTASADEIQNIVLKPFQAAIAAGIDSIMSAHLLVPALGADKIPATLSRHIMTGLLRDQLGFTGVTVSDALDMGAIAKNFPPEKAIPMAINAGCDQLIMPENNHLVIDIMRSAVRRGEVSEDRLNEATMRVLTMKERRGILSRAAPSLAKLEQNLNTAINRARAAEIAEKSITLIRGEDALPLPKDSRIFCLESGTAQAERSYFLEPRSFADHLAHDGRHVTKRKLSIISTSENPDTVKTRLEQMAHEAANHDVIVLAIYASIRLSSGTVGLPPDTLTMLKNLLQNAQSNHAVPVILASFGNPYVINDFPEASAILCAFSETQPSQRALARALRGEVQCKGTAPVPL